MDLTILYMTLALGLSGFVIQRSKFLTILIYFFTWTLMWSKYTADYMSYYTIYYSSFEFRDGGYMILCSMGRWLGLSFFEFFMGICFVALGIYCLFTLRYARKNSFVAALYMLFISQFDLVQFRNFLGFAIVLTVIPLLFNPSRNKIIIYCLVVALAATVHLTMIFYLIFVFMNREWFTAKRLRLVILPLLVLAVCIYFGFDYYMERGEKLMTVYSKNTSDLTRWMVAFLLVANVLFIYYWHRQPVELSLDEPEKSITLSKGKVVLMMNLSLLILFPLSLTSLTVLRLFKYVSIINFAFISNHMAKYTNWRLVPQTIAVGIYGLGYLVMFIFIHGQYFIKGVAKPIFFHNTFWPTIFSYFG